MKTLCVIKNFTLLTALSNELLTQLGLDTTFSEKLLFNVDLARSIH
jgi:hypothetical protein